MKRKPRPPWDPRNVYGAVVGPVVFGIFAAVLPEPSAGWGILWALIMAGDLLWTWQGRRASRHLDPRWRLTFGIAQFDLSGVFTAVPLWRFWGMSLWLGLVLLLLLALAAGVGHRYRYLIAQELINPRTRVGRVVGAIGMIGGGTAGMIGYGLGRAVELSSETPVAWSVLGSLMVAGGMALVLIAHAFWAFAENPNWRPE